MSGLRGGLPVMFASRPPHAPQDYAVHGTDGAKPLQTSWFYCMTCPRLHLRPTANHMFNTDVAVVVNYFG